MMMRTSKREGTAHLPIPPPFFPTRAATNGVVLATEKKLASILVDEASVEKIQHITGNVGAYIGKGADVIARAL